MRGTFERFRTERVMLHFLGNNKASMYPFISKCASIVFLFITRYVHSLVITTCLLTVNGSAKVN